MYKQNQQDPGQQAQSTEDGENKKADDNTTNSAKEEDIVDADFEEVKEDKEKKK
jgi:hypothetical protein